MRRDFAGLLLLVVTLFVGLAAVGVVLGPATSTETRYAEMGREMLESGDWIIPTLNGAPLLEKPPFEYWVNAASFAVFGVNDLSARIPSLVAGMLVLLVVAAGARRFSPESDGAETRRKRGLLAALALSTMPAFLVQAYTISIDIWLVLVTTIAGFCFLEFDRHAGKPALRWVLLFHAALGLSMLVKGPLTLGLVGGAAIVAAIVRRDLSPMRPFVHPLGIAVFAGIAVPWYLAANARIPGLLHDLVTRRLFGGIASSADFHPHSRVFVWAPLVGAFPWLAALPWAARPAIVGDRWRRTRASLATVLAPVSPLRGGAWRRGPALLALLLALAAPILFTFSKSRLVSYSSPSFPWIAFLVATGWPLDALAADPTAGRRRRVIHATIGAALVTLGIAAVMLARSATPTGCAVLAVGGSLLVIAAVLWPRPAVFAARPIPRVPVVVVGLMAVMSASAMADPFQYPAARPLWDAVARVRSPGDELGAVLPYTGDWGLFPWNSRSYVTFFDYPSDPMIVAPEKFSPTRFRPKADLGAWFRSPERRFLLMRKRDLSRPDYLADAPTYRVAEGDIYVVLTNHPLPGAGS